MSRGALLAALDARARRVDALRDTVTCADALALLRSLPAACVDAVVTDPPYNGVLARDVAEWDHQWRGDDEFIAWIGQLCQEWRRVLKPNGSLYVFAWPSLAARVEVEIGRWFNVLNSITWDKGAVGWQSKAEKEALRTFFPSSEKIIFAEQHSSDQQYASREYELNGQVYKPLKDWFRQQASLHNIALGQFNAALGAATNGGGLASGYFGSKVEFQLPTAERYAQMQEAFPAAFNREYEDLRREYEDLRREYEDLRRPFNVTARDQFTDVWHFRPVAAYPGKHPAEKPLALMQHIIAASTRPGALVLDPFAGSGTTLDAARQLDRHYIGGDMDAHWCRVARARLARPWQLPLLAAGA